MLASLTSEISDSAVIKIVPVNWAYILRQSAFLHRSGLNFVFTESQQAVIYEKADNCMINISFKS
jgi:hypothetical protein